MDTIFGSFRKTGEQKSHFQLERSVLANADISRIINSNEVQTVVRPAQENFVAHYRQKKNPLVNKKTMQTLNPNAEAVRQAQKQTNEANKKNRQEAIKNKRGITKSLNKDQKVALKDRKKQSKKWLTNVLANLGESYTRDIADQKAFE